MDSLPICGHRGEQNEKGDYLCDSPKLVPNPGHRTGDFCLTCLFHDNGPLHESRSPLPPMIAAYISSNIQSVSPTSQSPLLACPWHGETLKDESGKTLTKECPSCGGITKRQVVFRCDHNEKPMGEEVTISDCARCPKGPFRSQQGIQLSTQKLILEQPQSPGDQLVLSMAIETLHLTYPRRFITDVDVSCPDIYLHNPHITNLKDEKTARRIKVEYPAIHESDQRNVHFGQGFCEYLSKQLGVPLSLKVNRPYLYFSEEENGYISRVEEVTGKNTPHLVLNCGVKQDYTCKSWVPSYWQELVDLLNAYFQGKVVIVQTGEEHHLHKPLKNVINQIGKTNTREFIRLCRSADMGIGPVTFMQHVMAALQKPYVCLAGGREGKLFTEYPLQTTLHTIGALDCCKLGGCWKSRVVPLGDGDKKDTELCTNTVTLNNEIVQKCMSIITPEDVFRSVVRYYEGGALKL